MSKTESMQAEHRQKRYVVNETATKKALRMLEHIFNHPNSSIVIGGPNNSQILLSWETCELPKSEAKQ